ncbi:MAG: hypothetical protein Q7U96_03485 [Chloroflexota bacterium]|nr:hypothetical protein [Chloroflexota bacterium]
MVVDIGQEFTAVTDPLVLSSLARWQRAGRRQATPLPLTVRRELLDTPPVILYNRAILRVST